MSKNTKSKNSRSKRKQAAQEKPVASVNNNAAKEPKKETSVNQDKTVNSDKPESNVGHFLPFIPVALVLGYLPAFMRTVTFKTYLEEFDWFPTGNVYLVDVYLKSKANFLILIAAIMLFIMVFWGAKDGLKFFKKFDKFFIFLSVAALFTIIAASVSPNKGVVLHGTFESFESVFVILSYYIVCTYAYLCFQGSNDFYKDLQFVYRCSLPGFLYTALIGFFQIFGKNFYATDLGKKTFASKDYWDDLSTINIWASGEYSTLHNPDYVATFMGMWVPIFIYLFIASKDVFQKIIRGLLAILTLVDLLGAKTMEGILGFVFATGLIILMISFKNKKAFLGLIGLGVLAVIAAFIVPQTKELIISELGLGETTSSGKMDFIEKLYTYDDHVDIEMRGERYSISYSLSSIDDVTYDLKVDMKDASGNEIKGKHFAAVGIEPHYEFYEGVTVPMYINIYYYNTGTTDEEGQPITIKMLKLMSRDKSKAVNIYKDLDGYFMFDYTNGFLKLGDKENDIVDAGVFPELFFSGRGKMWNRTIPLLPKHILVGSGSGTFIIEYPQYYYVEKVYVGGEYNVKPHNMYLQFWVEQGLIALICLIIFWFEPIATVVAVMGKRKEWNESLLLLACVFVSVLTYLMAGLAGDSMLVHSPVFWVMLGLLYAGVKNYKMQSSVDVNEDSSSEPSAPLSE